MALTVVVDDLGEGRDLLLSKQADAVAKAAGAAGRYAGWVGGLLCED